jgi:hypothetical protein
VRHPGEGRNRSASGIMSVPSAMSEGAVEIPADTEPVRSGNGVDVRPKISGDKTRLLSLEDLDRRTAGYRKTAELIDRIEADLGGADRLSTAEQQIIRHAALTGAMLEDLGTRWLNGEPIDPALFATLSNSERRLYEAVGFRRRERDVTPDPLEYARDYTREDANG